MRTQIIVKRKSDELYHSDTYLGEEYADDSLCHWKYVKKYKVGDKWRYVYKSELSNTTHDTPKKMTEDEMTEYIPIKTYNLKSGTKRYVYLSADGKKIKDTHEKISTTKVSKLKKSAIMFKGRKFLRQWGYR